MFVAWAQAQALLLELSVSQDLLDVFVASLAKRSSLWLRIKFGSELDL